MAFYTLTRSSILQLINNDYLFEEDLYQISDRNNIILRAINNNTLEQRTSVMLYVPDYLGTGDRDWETNNHYLLIVR